MSVCLSKNVGSEHESKTHTPCPHLAGIQKISKGGLGLKVITLTHTPRKNFTERHFGKECLPIKTFIVKVFLN